MQASEEPGRMRQRFDTLFPDEQLLPVHSADAMAVAFDGLDHQRPATCGAYALAYLFPALGFRRLAGRELAAEDHLAHLASVVVEAEEIAPSEAISRRVAGGDLTEAEAIRRYGRIWYRYPVRASDDPVEVGTSPTGVMRAVNLGSAGRLSSVPIAGRAPGGAIQLTEARWVALLETLASHAGRWRWHAILNYQTDRLLKPDHPSYTVGNLALPDPEQKIPLDDWGVGHFAGVGGLWKRRQDDAWWLLLMDTYKGRGFDGYEPQPARLVRDGLVRDDGRGGGLVLILPRETVDDVAGAVSALGLQMRAWDNGSPAPDDWAWELGR